MEETLVTLCVFRSLLNREERIEFHPDEDSIPHLSFCISRMDVPALDSDGCGRGVEILVFQLSYSPSVHRVGIVRSEFPYVELHDTPSDFLVRSESYPDLTVLEFRMLHNILHRIHNLCHPGLVVSSEEGGSVGGYDGLALVVSQLGKIFNLESHPLHTRQRNVFPVVIHYDLRLYVVPGRVGRTVHMCDESHCRNSLPAV